MKENCRAFSKPCTNERTVDFLRCDTIRFSIDNAPARAHARREFACPFCGERNCASIGAAELAQADAAHDANTDATFSLRLGCGGCGSTLAVRISRRDPLLSI